MRGDPTTPRKIVYRGPVGGTLHVAGSPSALQQPCASCGAPLVVRSISASGRLPAPFPLAAMVAKSKIDGEDVAWMVSQPPNIGVWEPCL